MINNQLVKTLLTQVVEDESNLPIIEALSEGIETDEEIAKVHQDMRENNLGWILDNLPSPMEEWFSFAILF